MTDLPEGGSTLALPLERPVGRRRLPAWMRALWVACVLAYGLFLIDTFVFPRASTYTDFGGLPSVPAPDQIIVSFRNDDLSVYSDPSLEDSVLSLFRAHGVRQTFAFIPNPGGYLESDGDKPTADPKMLEKLVQWEREGLIEFAMHGLTHVRNDVGAGEFDGLPLETQSAVIRQGKTLLDSTLGTSVRIFAPPWNQVDEQTLEACAGAGMDIVSGYIGTPPAAGLTAVNTNAQLFLQPNEIPLVDRVLELASFGSGVRFVNVFYHSRVDFQTPEAFRRVDSLLTVLRADPKVEFLPISEIPVRYPEFLRAYSQSGWNIVEAENAMKTVKPYLSVFSRLPLIGSKVRELEERHTVALESYWCGEYAAAYLQAGVLVRQCGYWLALGRLVALLVVIPVLGFVFFVCRTQRAVLRVYAVAILPIVLLLLFFAVVSPVSSERTAEAARLALIFVGALLLVLPLLPQLRFNGRRSW